MALTELLPPPRFDRKTKDLKKKYRRSKQEIEDHLSAIRENPLCGGEYPGLELGVSIRKIREPLLGNKVGKSSGLRIVWYVNEELQCFMFITIYTKADYHSERAVRAEIKDAIKSALKQP